MISTRNSVMLELVTIALTIISLQAYTFPPHLGHCKNSPSSFQRIKTAKKDFSLHGVEKIAISEEAVSLKETLLDDIKKWKAVQDQTGSSQEDIDDASEQVLETCESLCEVAPDVSPHKYLGHITFGGLCPLDGIWRTMFSTMSLSAKSPLAAAMAISVADAYNGIITNVVDFGVDEKGNEPFFKQIQIVTEASAVKKRRVELKYKKAFIVTKYFDFNIIARRLKMKVPTFFLKGFGKELLFFIPPTRGFFRSRIIDIKNLVKAILKAIVKLATKFNAETVKEQAERMTKSNILKVPPRPHFDVMYIDNDLRIHRTNDDIIFVQANKKWEAANPFFD
uniref:Plastid lipid-associated protein/fibrillin conserved domain-containing protein n=1 Tax=Fibrocapsa japonica TaxID=94617 RepID=A0A7S2XZS3_9STRA|mmetsp:Transcript_3285/g.4809  ORF Transcript_3285/g.4809 Transcript_3285/m.4809 type:complete len:337 (+) Transcript_3285:120-1130(+)